jgi:hypothetical protein
MSAALQDFAPAIVAAHAAASGAMREGVAHAVRAGELLAQAKAALPHGRFGVFCAGLPFGATTARAYMRLACLDAEKRQRVADMPLRLALAALTKLRSPALDSGEHRAGIVIQSGSFGVSMWRDAADAIFWFEVHPALWPDGQTAGLHYALACVPASGPLTCDASRRPAAVTVESLAGALGAPIDRLRVFVGQPVLWASEVQE